MLVWSFYAGLFILCSSRLLFIELFGFDSNVLLKLCCCRLLFIGSLCFCIPANAWLLALSFALFSKEGVCFASNVLLTLRCLLGVGVVVAMLWVLGPRFHGWLGRCSVQWVLPALFHHRLPCCLVIREKVWLSLLSISPSILLYRSSYPIVSIIKIGDRWLPLLNSTVTSFNCKKRRFLLDLLRSGYKGAFAFLCAYVPRSRPLFFCLSCLLDRKSVV